MKRFASIDGPILAAAIIRPKQPIRQYAAIRGRAEERFWFKDLLHPSPACGQAGEG